MYVYLCVYTFSQPEHEQEGLCPIQNSYDPYI